MSNLLFVFGVFTLLRYGFGVSIGMVDNDLGYGLFFAATILDVFRFVKFWSNTGGSSKE